MSFLRGMLMQWIWQGLLGRAGDALHALVSTLGVSGVAILAGGSILAVTLVIRQLGKVGIRGLKAALPVAVVLLLAGLAYLWWTQPKDAPEVVADNAPLKASSPASADISPLKAASPQEAADSEPLRSDPAKTLRKRASSRGGTPFLWAAGGQTVIPILPMTPPAVAVPRLGNAMPAQPQKPTSPATPSKPAQHGTPSPTQAGPLVAGAARFNTAMRPVEPDGQMADEETKLELPGGSSSSSQSSGLPAQTDQAAVAKATGLAASPRRDPSSSLAATGAAAQPADKTKPAKPGTDATTGSKDDKSGKNGPSTSPPAPDRLTDKAKPATEDRPGEDAPATKQAAKVTRSRRGLVRTRSGGSALSGDPTGPTTGGNATHPAVRRGTQARTTMPNQSTGGMPGMSMNGMGPGMGRSSGGQPSHPGMGGPGVMGPAMGPMPMGGGIHSGSMGQIHVPPNRSGGYR